MRNPRGQSITIYVSHHQAERLRDLRQHIPGLPAGDGAALTYLAFRNAAAAAFRGWSAAPSPQLLLEVARALTDLQARAEHAREDLVAASAILGRARFTLLDAHAAFEELARRAGTLEHHISALSRILDQMPGALQALADLVAAEQPAATEQPNEPPAAPPSA